MGTKTFTTKISREALILKIQDYEDKGYKTKFIYRINSDNTHTVIFERPNLIQRIINKLKGN